MYDVLDGMDGRTRKEPSGDRKIRQVDRRVYMCIEIRVHVDGSGAHEFIFIFPVVSRKRKQKDERETEREREKQQRPATHPNKKHVLRIRQGIYILINGTAPPSCVRL
jgi:hypothetical protein